MTTRIAKIEQFIPTSGLPVYQVIEEETLSNGQVIRLDPRNPTADELADAKDQFAAAQQARIAELEAAETQRDELLAEVESLKAQLPQPLGDREITPREFLGRISAEDRLAIMSSSDPRCMMAMMELFTTLTVNLDSPELAGLVDALIDAGIDIDADDRAAIFA